MEEEKQEANNDNEEAMEYEYDEQQVEELQGRLATD